MEKKKKAIMKYNFTSTDNSKRLTIPNIGKGRATELSYTVGESIK
jgi:hypothetical protein